jgi:hypothetical protein
MRRARGVKVPDVPDEFKTAALVALFGIAATSLTSILAVLTALMSGVKVWVGPEAKLARRQWRWPPSSIPGRALRPNHARWVVVAVMLSLGVPLIFGLILLLMVVLGKLEALVPVGLLIGVEMMVMLTLMIGGAFLILMVSHSILPHVVAHTPEDCWPLHDTESYPDGSSIMDRQTGWEPEE